MNSVVRRASCIGPLMGLFLFPSIAWQASPAFAQAIGGTGTGTGGGGGGGGTSGSGTTGDNGTAGTGGSGGTAAFPPGSGGKGGAGLSVSSSTTNNGTIYGGMGGAGSSGGGGGGGGIDIAGSNLTFTNTGTIRGGAGGVALPSLYAGSGGAGGGTGGGTGGINTYGGGGGGGGAINVEATSSNVTIVNSGSVTGGNGNNNGAGGGNGGGGAGIAGSGIAIVNSGSITGGLIGDGTTRANAILFTGGANTLTLQGSNWSLIGNIAISGTGGSLAFSQVTDQTLSNAITGNGSIIQNGIGTLTLSGVNTYTGATEVAAGRLVVTGSIRSNVTVDSGGSFGGTGMVAGNVTNNGIVRPDIGTLSVIGTYTNNAGGTYQVEVTPAGQSDRIAVIGTAVLNGGTVAVMADSGSYAKSTTYTILTAIAGVSGTFANVTSNLAFLTPSLSYDANDVFVTLLQSSNAFALGAQTNNQRAIGIVLDRANAFATGDFAAVLNALSALDTTQGPKALDTISGQPIANFGTVNVQAGNAFMDAVGNQIGALHGGLGGGMHVAMAVPPDQACDFACDAGEPSRYSAWISGVGGLGSAPGNTGSSGLTYNFGGTAVGADYRFDPQILLGIGAGYIRGTQWASGLAGQGTTDAFSASVYASYAPGKLYVDGLVGYAYSLNDMTRSITLPGLAARMAQGRTNANQVLGQIETGYRLDMPTSEPTSITPFVRLQGSTTTQNGFTESGADSLDLIVAPQTTNSLRTTLGANFAAEIREINFNVRLGWQHEYADTSRPMTASFAGAPGNPFTVYGASPPRDAVIVGFAARTRIAAATELYARYDGEVDGGADNHAFTAGLRFTW